MVLVVSKPAYSEQRGGGIYNEDTYHLSLWGVVFSFLCSFFFAYLTLLAYVNSSLS